MSKGSLDEAIFNGEPVTDVAMLMHLLVGLQNDQLSVTVIDSIFMTLSIVDSNI
jgi:hypothetical protein